MQLSTSNDSDMLMPPMLMTKNKSQKDSNTEEKEKPELGGAVKIGTSTASKQTVLGRP